MVLLYQYDFTFAICRSIIYEIRSVRILKMAQKYGIKLWNMDVDSIKIAKRAMNDNPEVKITCELRTLRTLNTELWMHNCHFHLSRKANRAMTTWEMDNPVNHIFDG